MINVKILSALSGIALTGIIAGIGIIYSGIYNIAGDEPHWTITASIIEMVRERSIERRAQGAQTPDLNDPQLIGEGAEHYSAMCTGCHLAPGMADTEIRMGLYPKPPNLAEQTYAGIGGDAARQFWIIKHGIKLTAMPAWGKTHDDRAIWGLVAFLQKLPGMSPTAYAALTEGDQPHAEEAPVGNVHTSGSPHHRHGEHSK